MGPNHFSVSCTASSNESVAGNGKHCIVGSIEAEKELLHLFERSIGYVIELLADGRPLIRMYAIGQRTKQMPHIAVKADSGNVA